jgi:hypothetical protein
VGWGVPGSDHLIVVVLELVLVLSRVQSISVEDELEFEDEDDYKPRSVPRRTPSSSSWTIGM